MLKKLLSTPFVQLLIGRAISAYMNLAAATTRWERINEAAAAPYRDERGKVVVVVWHGRILQAHLLWRFAPGAPKIKVLISNSREGAIISETARALGMEPVRGSAAKGMRQKGGVEAMRAMARHIEDGGAMCITPDGPRGPRMRAKLGAAHLAKIAGAPLVPLAWAAKRQHVLKSWDSMMFPLPFTHGVLIWGNPIAPPAPDADEAAVEAVRLAVETELNRISEEADRRMGREPIAPAPTAAETRAARAQTATAQ